MNIILVVTQAFGPHTKGEHVIDPTSISAILAGEFSGHVVRVQAPAASDQEH